MNRLTRGLAYAAAAAAAGCAPGTLQIQDLHGVEYVVEGTHMAIEDRDGTTRILNRRAILTVRDGRLFRDGEDLGDLRPGDRVRLARSGRVFVNDAERNPDR